MQSKFDPIFVGRIENTLFIGGMEGGACRGEQIQGSKNKA